MKLGMCRVRCPAGWCIHLCKISWSIRSKVDQIKNDQMESCLNGTKSVLTPRSIFIGDKKCANPQKHFQRGKKCTNPQKQGLRTHGPCLGPWTPSEKIEVRHVCYRFVIVSGWNNQSQSKNWCQLIFFHGNKNHLSSNLLHKSCSSDYPLPKNGDDHVYGTLQCYIS